MNRSLVSTIGVIFSLAIAIPGHTSEAPPEGAAPVAQVAITEIQAKLFYSNSGRFSSNLFEKKDLVLHNVIIGEGVGVEGPSENTLLIVTVSGVPKGTFEGLKLRVSAKTETRKLLDQECEVGIFNGNGNWYAPFLLYDTGCEPVTITAALGPTGKPLVVTGTIPFSCAE